MNNVCLETMKFTFPILEHVDVGPLSPQLPSGREFGLICINLDPGMVVVYTYNSSYLGGRAEGSQV